MNNKQVDDVDLLARKSKNRLHFALLHAVLLQFALISMQYIITQM